MNSNNKLVSSNYNKKYSDLNYHLKVQTNENYYMNTQPINSSRVEYDFVSKENKKNKLKYNFKKSNFSWQINEFN